MLEEYLQKMRVPPLDDPRSENTVVTEVSYAEDYAGYAGYNANRGGNAMKLAPTVGNVLTLVATLTIATNWWAPAYTLPVALAGMGVLCLAAASRMRIQPRATPSCWQTLPLTVLWAKRTKHGATLRGQEFATAEEALAHYRSLPRDSAALLRNGTPTFPDEEGAETTRPPPRAALKNRPPPRGEGPPPRAPTPTGTPRSPPRPAALAEKQPVGPESSLGPPA